MKANEQFDKWVHDQWKTNAQIAKLLSEQTGLDIKHQHIRYWRKIGTPRINMRPHLEKLTGGKIKAEMWGK